MRKLLVGGTLHLFSQSGQNGLNSVIRSPAAEDFELGGIDGSSLVIDNSYVDLRDEATLWILHWVLVSTPDGQEVDAVLESALEMKKEDTPGGPTMVPVQSVKVVSSPMHINRKTTFSQAIRDVAISQSFLPLLELQHQSECPWYYSSHFPHLLIGSFIIFAFSSTIYFLL